MKLAVSNIAWSQEEDPSAFDLLRRMGIKALEIAPPRVWPHPTAVSEESVFAYRQEMRNEKGFEIVAFQSLLFGKNELTLFPSESSQPCFDYLLEIGRLGARLGAKVLVFGSPRNRTVPDGMSEATAMSEAINFFSKLGAKYAEMGIVLGLEPNPSAYNCNFIRNVDEAVQLVRTVDSPGFRLHLDAGALQMNAEKLENVVSEHLDLISHVHASEPMLVPLSDTWDGHHRLATLLKEGGYTGWVSLEMKRPETGLLAVKKAVDLFQQLYA